MKTLTLLRHAKSSWDDPVGRDFDRPLNARGRRAAVTVGRHLRGQGVSFDYLIASPAVRVVETLDGFASGYGPLPDVVEDRRIYLASAATLLEVVQGLPASVERVLMVGHNPGLEDLVLALVPDGTEGLRDAVEEKYPTASVAEMRFDASDWAAVRPGGATLTRFVRPRDLDPALGPDAVGT
ncbi:SixA phosphatase family protein [Sphingomonas lenta]|uniref:Histidine phosphatase family protein n=1 Tax=Sphingomonas lenta TaxID=1141887 RepID=A0A2A2SF99_9SPHN|nr:histidine phosphatase family protein [Sphingomonas lenta]PAX07883.1 histidine phosphatase family protein [Sphingomonas lenta]